MRGVNQKTHKDAHVDGNLKLFPKPFAFKGTSHSWMRNLKRSDSTTERAREPALPDGPTPIQKRLRTIASPDCKVSQCTKSHRLHVKVGFCRLTCQKCRCTSSTRRWRCPCGVQRHKCKMHVHKIIIHCTPIYTIYCFLSNYCIPQNEVLLDTMVSPLAICFRSIS